jgi:hypothetical protein
MYAKQLDDGRYVSIQRSLTKKHIFVHLQEKITLGIYLLDNQNQTSLLVFDADNEDEFQKLKMASKILFLKEVPSYLETSRRGGHMWLFFGRKVPGKDVRYFGTGISITFKLENIEMFPKQDHLQGGPGSLIRLPFGVHRKSGKRYEFITTDGDDLAEKLEIQISLLGQPKKVNKAGFQYFLEIGKRTEQPDAEKNNCKGSDNHQNMDLTEKIIARVSVMDFVSRYVKLTSTGRGLCPFHDDHKKSFSVNIEENYWNCFAGCGGGNIINFWMLWKKCNFHEAIKELEEILF